MAVDPNDLLIFKLRGMTSQPAQARQKTAAAAPQPKPSAAQQPAAAPPQAKPAATEVEQPIQPQATAQATKKRRAIWPSFSIQESAKKREKKQEDLERAMAPSPEEELVARISREVQQVQGAQAQQQGVTSYVAPAPKKMTKGKQESIDAAKGYVCVNHPWRPAYAVCDYCKRPFCYADLVELNDRFYCLEDIDKVTSKGVVPQVHLGRFYQLPGVVFLANALLMAFFIYPQAGFFISHVAKVGLLSFLLSLNYAYGIATLNFLIAIVSLAIGILLLVSPRHIYIGGIVGMLVLVGASYEYLNSEVAYLLFISILAFISTALLLYNRINITASSSMEEVRPTDIEWPKLETF